VAPPTFWTKKLEPFYPESKGRVVTAHAMKAYRGGGV